MNEILQVIAISGGIFAVMMVAQLGRRHYSWHKIAIPLVSIAAFGYGYLHAAPSNTSSIVLYLVGALIGAALAVPASLFTRLERNADGSVSTVCGRGFLITWAAAVLVRIAFVVAVDQVPAVRNAVGEFCFHHQIPETAIAPFFVLMALVMVVGRVAALAVRVRRLPLVAAAPRVAVTV